MMKKILCIIMSVLMLALPFAGMAETPRALLDEALLSGKSVNVTSGITLNTDLFTGSEQLSAIAELLNLQKDKISVQQNQFTVSRTLNDQEVYNLTFDLEDNGLFIGSSLLEKPIILDGTELGGLVKNYILPILASEGVLTQEQADTCTGWVDQILAGKTPENMEETLTDIITNLISKKLSANTASEEADTETAEVETAEDEKISLSFSKTIVWLIDFMFSGTEAEVPSDYAVNANAVSGIQYTVTLEDIESLIDAIAADLTSSKIPAMDRYAAEIGMTTADMIASDAEQLKSYLEGRGNISAVIAFFTDEDDNPVAGSFDLTQEFDGSTEAEAGTNEISCTGWVNEADQQGSCSLMLVQDNEITESVDLTWNTYAQESGEIDQTANCTVFYGDADYMVDVIVMKNYTDVPYASAAVTFSMKAADADDSSAVQLGQITADLKTTAYANTGDYQFDFTMGFSMLGTDVMTLTAAAVTGASMPSIATDDVTRLLSMNTEELNAWLQEESTFAAGKLNEIMQLLPEDVINMMDTDSMAGMMTAE